MKSNWSEGVWFSAHFAGRKEDITNFLGASFAAMSFESFLEEWAERFSQPLEISLSVDKIMTQLPRQSGSMNYYGVYLVYGSRVGISDREHPFYIGCSGTWSRGNGTMSRQTIGQRLVSRPGGKPRTSFWVECARASGCEELIFTAYNTWGNEQMRLLPKKAEADLMQRFFELNGNIPPWNKKY